MNKKIKKNRWGFNLETTNSIRTEVAAKLCAGVLGAKHACRNISLAALLYALAGSVQPAQAGECGHKYTVKASDTLASIAQDVYGASSKWTLIFYANQVQFDNKPLLNSGSELRIPCVTVPEAAKTNDASGSAVTGSVNQPKKRRKIEMSKVKSNIHFLTADDFRPFTDRALPAGGMITDIIDKALTKLEEKTSVLAHRVSWVNDWSAHLNPLLSRKAFDMGFPWYRPNCEQPAQLDKPARFRCENFFFSKPVFEILVLFFTNKDSDFKFTSDSDVVGKRLCRPTGYFTFDLDQNGRNWVKDEKVVLLRPQSVEECFRLLERNEVDAVALNEFTGREAVNSMEINDKIRMVEQPISLLSQHIVVAKTHPKARIYLHYVNSALNRIRETGAYNKIVDRHLSAFWGTQGGS